MNAPSLPSFDFSSLSESDVREEIIAPVLRALGYRSGTENTIVREHAIELRYPNMFLGRKKTDRDPVLRGRPDYICEARGITRWAIKAKSPATDISPADIEQAHSYAFHPELAAPLFVLSNGREWLVYESNRGPAAEPLLRLTYKDLQERFYLLSNLLSPEGLNRRYPVQELDLGQPLALGVGSSARIVSGFTRYDEIDTLVEGLPPGMKLPDADRVRNLIGYKTAIVGDRCYRDEQLGIVADVRMHFPHDSMQKFADLMGITQNRYTTREALVSTNPSRPTIFEFANRSIVPAGVPVFNLITWSMAESPIPIHITWYAEAIGHLDGSCVAGTYSARMIAEPHGFPIRQWAFMRGAFEVQLQAA